MIEGRQNSLYSDDGSTLGNCTIGVGHLIHNGKCDGRAEELTILEEIKSNPNYIYELFRENLLNAEDAVNQNVQVPLTEEQFDALVSFNYNLGEYILPGTDLLTELNNENYEAVPRELKRFVRDTNRKIIEGLIRRREFEANLFSTGDYQLGKW